MTVTRNTGADFLPFTPSYPRARLRAMRDARARRERERPREDYDADRLARDLAGRPPDVRVNDGDGDAATREYLRHMGWTDERLRRAMVALRDDLQGRVHLPPRPPVTAGGGPGGGLPQSRPPSPVASRLERLDMVARHVAAARAAGLDPVEKWPSLAGLLASEAGALVAGGYRMPTTEYNRRQREQEAERNLAARWRVLNDRFFGGALTAPRFEIVTDNDLVSARQYELLSSNAWYVTGTKPGRGTITLRARKVGDDGTLVHEMVHQWQDHRGLPIGHGDEFIRRANVVASLASWTSVRDATTWPHDQSLAASGTSPARCGVGLVGSTTRNRPAKPDQEPVDRRNPLLAGSTPGLPGRPVPGRRARRAR
jgi:hypothetical protein